MITGIAFRFKSAPGNYAARRLVFHAMYGFANVRSSESFAS